MARVVCPSLFIVFLSTAGVASAQQPTAPKAPPTVAQRETELHLLLSHGAAEKVWTQTDASTLNDLLTKLTDAKGQIDGIVAPVAPHLGPKPAPRPTPTPVKGPKPKPTNLEIESAAADLHRALEDATGRIPALNLPDALNIELDGIARTLRSTR